MFLPINNLFMSWTINCSQDIFEHGQDDTKQLYHPARLMLAPERHTLNFLCFSLIVIVLSRESGCIAINVMQFVCCLVTRVLLACYSLLKPISVSLNLSFDDWLCEDTTGTWESLRYFRNWQSRREQLLNTTVFPSQEGLLQETNFSPHEKLRTYTLSLSPNVHSCLCLLFTVPLVSYNSTSCCDTYIIWCCSHANKTRSPSWDNYRIRNAITHAFTPPVHERRSYYLSAV